jgi:hypothetical protein
MVDLKLFDLKTHLHSLKVLKDSKEPMFIWVIFINTYQNMNSISHQSDIITHHVPSEKCHYMLIRECYSTKENNI